MQTPANVARRNRLRLQVMVVATLSLLVLGYEVVDACGDYMWSKAQTPLIARMEKDQDEIFLLDDVLSTSVRTAALSADPQAELRYRRAEPRLVVLLRDVQRQSVSTRDRAISARIVAVHGAVVATQRRILELARRGNTVSAQRLLESGEFAAQRAAYAKSMALVRHDVERAGDSVDDALLTDLFWNGVSAVGTALLLILGSLYVLRITRRWQAVLMEANRQLKQKSVELERFNTQLDHMVSERTNEADQARKKLDFLAYYDPLSGLANRGLFLERVAQDLRNAASGGFKVAVGLIDLERFKNINDSLGQLAGDALLKQVAEWLERVVGETGLVARVDSDHFAIVLPEVRPGGNLARLLDKLIEAFMAHPFRLNDAVFRIAAKGGVALFPDDGDDADLLFKYAEAALKQAKAHGDRYLFYTQAMTDQAAGKPTLENQLRQAIENGEFVLHYQPKVNLVSGLLIGAEALIRWNDPLTGLVPPYKFIPILEETGLIHEVGRWAMRKAVEDYLRWCSVGLPAVRIAVNVSALQLRNRGFIDEVRQVIGIDPRAAAGMELEITESMVMEDVKLAVASLKTIRALGITIAIDDFGTGFSSLGYLSKLPIDTLKIDRSFIVDMTTGPEGLALVSTIINLAHSLKLKVVGEGVETEEQSRLLRLLGCEEMQGYLFSKPVPADVFEAKFLQRLARAA